MKYGVKDRMQLVEIDEVNSGVPFIKIDEDQLNIFDYYNEDIPDWIPPNTVAPYDSLIVWNIDIETSGGIAPKGYLPDTENHDIKLIGIKNQYNKNKIFDCFDNEYIALHEFIDFLKAGKPHIIALYNGFDFDLPFIMGRCDHYGIKHPFKFQKDSRGERIKKVRSTCVNNGMTTEYTPVWCTLYNDDGSKHDVAIVDLYHEVLNLDFSQRKLTSYRLKDAPYQMGLVKDEIIDIGYPQMLVEYSRWYEGGRETMIKYLESDLNLTKVLGDKLLPPIYFQKLFLDWKLQSIFSSGNGSKHNSILCKQYDEEYVNSLITDDKCRFAGGLVSSIAGLFCCKGKKVYKFDVTSLYPHLMLLYGIFSRKDKNCMSLRILKHMLNTRKMYKKDAKKYGENTPEYKLYTSMSDAIKILVNSMYGSLGTKGIPFNDYVMAAFVTAYGRAILKHMIKCVKLIGGLVISVDTDGIFFQYDDCDGEVLTKKLNEMMPGNDNFKINLELEVQAEGFYVPGTDKQSPDVTIVDENNDGLIRAGLKKNYVICQKNKNGEYKLKFNGIYRKRNRWKIQKEIIPQIVKLMVSDGKNAAREYVRSIYTALDTGTVEPEAIQITRTIAKSEKKILSLGFCKARDSVTIWKIADIPGTGSKGQPIKSGTVPGWTNKFNRDKIDFSWYKSELQKEVNEIASYIRTL